MKTILMLIVGLMLAGCGSMENEVRKSSTSDLLLRRSQLMLSVKHDAHELG